MIKRNSFFSRTVALAISTIGLSSFADGGNTIYGGVGTESMFGVGALFDKSNQIVYGFDIAREGTMTDRTGGRASLYYSIVPRDTKSAVSINAIVAKSAKMKHGDFVFGAVIGIRTTKRECAGSQSYLGYDCYADADPKVSYKFNGGGMLGWRNDKIFAGVRITGESNALLLGFRFQLD